MIGYYVFLFLMYLFKTLINGTFLFFELGMCSSWWSDYFINRAWDLHSGRNSQKWHRKRQGIFVSIFLMSYSSFSIIPMCLENNLSWKKKILCFRARKLLSIRLWEDQNGRRWSRSVTDMQYEILCVSQFTLYYYLKGNKPDFHAAMPGAQSQEFYNSFLDTLKKLYDPCKIKGKIHTLYD